MRKVDIIKWEMAREMASQARLGAVPKYTTELHKADELEQTLASVMDACHFTAPVSLLGVWEYPPFAVSSGPGLIDDDSPCIASNPMVAEFIEQRYLAATYAHEIGHLVAEDSLSRRHSRERLVKEFGVDWDWLSMPDEVAAQMTPIFHEHEYAADRFAFEHGYGQDLADWLDYSTSVTNEVASVPPRDAESATHPSVAERVRRLRAMLKRPDLNVKFRLTKTKLPHKIKL